MFKSKEILKRILLLASIFGVLLMVLAFLVARRDNALEGTSLPNPNGYDDLLAAADALQGEPLKFLDLAKDDLRAAVSTNTESLRLLRLGLSRPCMAPTHSMVANHNALFLDLPKLKSLAWLLKAEGKLAELEGRPGAAARSYGTAIHLGNEMSRGGFLINRLVGIACEGIGGIVMAKLAPQLNSEQARPVITELEQIDRTRVTWEEIRRNERLFSRHQASQSGNPIALIKEWWEGHSISKGVADKHLKSVARLRLLVTELALRCFQSEQGRVPERLEDLVPKYLQRVPLDPFNNQPLIYRPHGTNWLCYSVAMDRVDDGGKPLKRSASGKGAVPFFVEDSGPETGDLVFDSPW